MPPATRPTTPAVVYVSRNPNTDEYGADWGDTMHVNPMCGGLNHAHAVCAISNPARFQPTRPITMCASCVGHRPADHEWVEHAACRTAYALDWIPTKSADPDHLDTLRYICEPCPVRGVCLTDALSESNQIGFRAGHTETERKALKRMLKHARRTTRKATTNDNPGLTPDPFDAPTLPGVFA